MLVISRTRDEQTVIRDAAGKLLAVVTIVDLRGDKVRLGFVADPDQIVIDRGEVDAAKERDRAAGLPPRQKRKRAVA